MSLAVNAGAFTLAAVALLGSPGPGIAALLAVGRSKGVKGGLGFYFAMQAGLAIAAGLSAVGLASILIAIPSLATALALLATAYLLWLAWSIATAPIGPSSEGRAKGASLTDASAFLIGIANPKAYLAFTSLIASFTVTEGGEAADAAVKWALCVAVMLVVDLAWLATGAMVGRLPLRPRAERVMNIAMGAAIVVAAMLAFA